MRIHTHNQAHIHYLKLNEASPKTNLEESGEIQFYYFVEREK